MQNNRTLHCFLKQFIISKQFCAFGAASLIINFLIFFLEWNLCKAEHIMGLDIRLSKYGLSSTTKCRRHRNWLNIAVMSGLIMISSFACKTSDLNLNTTCLPRDIISQADCLVVLSFTFHILADGFSLHNNSLHNIQLNYSCSLFFALSLLPAWDFFWKCMKN